MNVWLKLHICLYDFILYCDSICFNDFFAEYYGGGVRLQSVL